MLLSTKSKGGDRTTAPPALPLRLPSLSMMAVGEALVHMRITVLQLCLGILFHLSGWAQIGHSQHHSPPEVVIPLRITGTTRGMRPPDWVSYNLHFGGQKHIIHMKAKKLLVSKSFSVFTYTDQGAQLEDYPFVQSDCYYDGFVEGDPESLVALSTCLGGFQGILEIHDTVYEIKPKRLSATFEHLVYKMDREKTQFPPMRCGLTEEELARQLKLQRRDNSVLRQSGYEGWWTHRWYLETVLIVDYEQFLYKQSNVSFVIEEVFLIASHVHSLLSPLDVELTLLGIEVWNKKNFFQITNNIYMVMDEFCHWKRNNLDSRKKHDLAHFLVKKDFGMYFGLAYVGTACISGMECGVIAFMDDLYEVSLTVAHEMGHNLGMYHDVWICKCGQRNCIMSEIYSDGTKFSNCSYGQMWENFRFMFCMLSVPKQKDIFRGTICGNGVVDEGEECDCGSPISCKNHPCCSRSCTLQFWAECASGLCCDECLLLPPGKVCREKETECDLPEWCNGTSPECPEDVYVQDGVRCMDGGYCHEKRCNARDIQCRRIFGKESRSAQESCYTEMNSRGDRFGNCGLGEDHYIMCNISDFLCGRIQCENVGEMPSLKDHTTVHCDTFNSVTCCGTDYHFGITIPDIGDVKDGTECGTGQVCIHQKCVSSVSLWTTYCLPEDCAMNGICNNKHHCHCDSNWAPPNCTEKGHGGSIDSGPPPGKEVPGWKNRRKKPLFGSIFLLLFMSFLLFVIIVRKTLLKKEEQPVQPSPKMEELGAQSSTDMKELGDQTSPDMKELGDQTSPDMKELGDQTSLDIEELVDQTSTLSEPEELNV